MNQLSSLEDVEYEIESMTWVIRTMMNNLSELEKEREKLVKKIYGESIGELEFVDDKNSIGVCYCTYGKLNGEVRLIRNHKCPTHGKGQRKSHKHALDTA